MIQLFSCAADIANAVRTWTAVGLSRLVLWLPHVVTVIIAAVHIVCVSMSSCMVVPRGTLQCGRQSSADFVGSDAPLCHRLSRQSLQSGDVVIKLVAKVGYRKNTDRLSQESQIRICILARECPRTLRLHRLSPKPMNALTKRATTCGRSIGLRLSSNHKTSLLSWAHFSPDPSKARSRFMLLIFTMA